MCFLNLPPPSPAALPTAPHAAARQGPGDSFRVLLQERHKGGDLRLLASAPLHMHAVLQCPFAGELSLRAPGPDGAPDGGPLWAKVQAVVASYTEGAQRPPPTTGE